jgi:hypothetical protein
MFLVAVILVVLLNSLQFFTGLLLSPGTGTSQSILFNINSEQILRYTAISLMFITVAISRTGDIDD